MTERSLIGYVDPWSVRAGEAIHVHATAKAAAPARASIVRVICACSEPGAPGWITEAISGAEADFQLTPQQTVAGSYGVAPSPHLAERGYLAFSIAAFPTTRRPGSVFGLYDDSGAGLGLRWTDAGTYQFVLCQKEGGETILVEVEGPFREWGFLLAEWDGLRAVARLTVARQGGRDRFATAAAPDAASWTQRPRLWFAAKPAGDRCAVDHWDGRLEAGALLDRAPADLSSLFKPLSPRPCPREALAAWDFSLHPETDRLVDVGPSRCEGRLYQGPVRAVPGAFWQRRIFDPRQAPAEFSCIHFHSDDLADAKWLTAATLTLPQSMASGVYAVKIECGGETDMIPFWVRPGPMTAPKPLAVLVPTFTYLAYANAPDAMRGPNYAALSYAEEAVRDAHPEFGRSLYDRHLDGSGVSLSSRRRPILSLRGETRPWGFPADSLITAWLADQSRDFDVLTDEDLDREGYEALAPYRCVITGNHPEYYSRAMLDGMEAWLERGGRLIYMGGNGFYWRSSVSRDGACIEVRRAEDGTRPWIAEPGEYHHQLDGELGGLWRRLGRPPNHLVGQGFAAQGFETSSAYRVDPETYDTWAAFALNGLETPLVGTQGLLGGGAAGQEIDRVDTRNGSPPETIILASSRAHDPAMLRTKEEFLSTTPPFADRKIRADISITPKPNGGAVFAVGSMAFVGALPKSIEDRSAANMLANVIDRFLDPAPLTSAGA